MYLYVHIYETEWLEGPVPVDVGIATRLHFELLGSPDAFARENGWLAAEVSLATIVYLLFFFPLPKRMVVEIQEFDESIESL